MDRIKSLSLKVLEEHKSKFGKDFADNKKALNQVAIIRSKGLKNEIAGYITKSVRREMIEEAEKIARIKAAQAEEAEQKAKAEAEEAEQKAKAEAEEARADSKDEESSSDVPDPGTQEASPDQADVPDPGTQEASPDPAEPARPE
ncbi:MAG: hypothetical protein EB829_03645 [Nitrosopumilus sp. H8]|nr:MAG: hypothetical protein EB830_03275 [Nitrosopumilus sp. H13]RNJ78777.1 MAG: hypothetical protein EB829_03645 [Nitrosopumilus sp. H8]